MWAAVSQLGASRARSTLPQANYHMLPGDLHTYAELVVSQSEYDQVAGNPSALRALQLTKLLGMSTLLFNFSHGVTGGFYDDANPMQLADWASCARTTAVPIVSEFRNLMCRFVFMYSCLCGATPSAIRTAFQMEINNPVGNTACFCFSESVFSTLYAGNLKDDQPYNSPGGALLMTDKLSLHADRLMRQLAGGERAFAALSNANNAFPPRKFSHGANGVNYTDVHFMANVADGDARLHTVYRRQSESDTDWIQFGTWGLLSKLLAPHP